MMWLTSLRRHVRTRSFALLLSVAVCGGSLNGGHAGGDDPACAAALVQHDHAAHKLTTPGHRSDSPDEHCNLCHLQRLLHTALGSVAPAAVAISPSDSARPSEPALAVSMVAGNLSSRAPPANLL